MFVSEKCIGRYTYVYLVETVREDGRAKQRIIRNLGRKEDVERRGDLDRLARVSRSPGSVMVITDEPLKLSSASIPYVVEPTITWPGFDQPGRVSGALPDVRAPCATRCSIRLTGASSR
jgi:hypothetical protein